MENNAKPRKISPVIVLALLVPAVAAGLRLRDAWHARRPVLAEAALRGKTFTVEVADTDEKKERGLGRRDALPADRGMYFPFASENHWIFWMKDMRFPIDILWIRDGKIVDLDTDAPVVPAGQELETYSPSEPADAVLELNAGTAAELGVQRGDLLLLRVRP